jgi:hypothetical protein
MRRTPAGIAALLWSVAVLSLSSSASAALGQDVASVHVDQARMKGSEHIVQGPGPTVHEIHLPGGTLVREYLSPAGVVFAVSWRGPFRPDLQQLLGRYFDPFREAAQAARKKHRGRGPLSIESPGLVVSLGGHQRAFLGRAYVPALVPPSVTVKDIQ